jgi:hypothetical protein
MESLAGVTVSLNASFGNRTDSVKKVAKVFSLTGTEKIEFHRKMADIELQQ